MNEHLKQNLMLDEVVACYHDDADNCDCRKPKPGMIFGLAAKYNVNLESSIVVGDRWRDIEAGRRAKCRTVLIDYGYDERKAEADFTAKSLLEAAPDIVAFLEQGNRK
jgi:D-glycero-D-manno-heptose 1,7-bisphosphate phosphatase